MRLTPWRNPLGEGRRMKLLAAIPLLLLAAVPPREDLKPGLIGKYWHVGHTMRSFPADVLGQDPQRVRIDGFIDFDSTEHRGLRDVPWTEYVAVEWTGVLRLPNDGEYTFYLRSLDGSKLFVDNREIINHDGRHTVKETASETVMLKGGDHDLRVLYFQNGLTRCVLSWKHDGTGRQVIPSTALWHPYDDRIDKESR